MQEDRGSDEKGGKGAGKQDKGRNERGENDERRLERGGSVGKVAGEKERKKKETEEWKDDKPSAQDPPTWRGFLIF
jgi:hypothetical protein